MVMLTQAASSDTGSDFLSAAAPYLVSGLVALAGVVLGWLTQRRSERDAWQREKRLSAYSEFLELSHRSWEFCAEVYARDLRSPDIDVHRANEIRNAFGRSITSVGLLGPSPVSEAAHQLDSAHEGIWTMLDRPEERSALRARGSNLLPTDLGKAVSAGSKAFADAARSALGIKG